MTYNVLDFGAVANEETLCTDAVQRAIENVVKMVAVLCDSRGAGTR